MGVVPDRDGAQRHPGRSSVAYDWIVQGGGPEIGPGSRQGYGQEIEAGFRHAVFSIPPGYDTARAVDSQHLRAARAMLGWAMSDLAQVSGLSLSTIRRLEQSARAVSPRNHRAAVDALRLGGIRFLTLDDGTTALAGLGTRPAPPHLA